MRREFRFSIRKENKKPIQEKSKTLLKNKQKSENQNQIERLSFMDIQQITRSMLHDFKAHQNNMGIISSIKGKMYCLKLGQVSSNKDFTRFFYSNQFRLRKQKGQPLTKLSSNSMYVTEQFFLK